MRIVYIGKLTDDESLYLEKRGIFVVGRFTKLNESLDFIIEQQGNYNKVFINLNADIGENFSSDLKELQDSLKLLGSASLELIICFENMDDYELARINNEIYYEPNKVNYSENINVSFIAELINPPKAEAIKYAEVQSTLETNKSVAICSLTPGSGSTFIALNLAKMIGNSGIKCSVTEYPENDPVISRYIDLGSRLRNRHLKSVHSFVEQQQIIEKEYYITEEHITWNIMIGNEKYDATEEYMNRFLYAVQTTGVHLFDMSTKWQNKNAESILNRCGEIWVIFAPNPAKLEDQILQAKSYLAPWFNKVRFIGNGFSEYEQKDYVVEQINYLLSNPKLPWISQEEFLKNNQHGEYIWKNSKIDEIIPSIDRDKVAKATWAGLILAELGEAKDDVSKAFSGVATIIIPEFGGSKRKGVFSKLFKK